jgi:hypothetical protein
MKLGLSIGMRTRRGCNEGLLDVALPGLWGKRYFSKKRQQHDVVFKKTLRTL